MHVFYVYVLCCGDGSFYDGHTDNLEKRFEEHRSGVFGGYTADHLPVQLLYFEELGERIDALEREMQIKKWSRAKKEALIAGTLPRHGKPRVTGTTITRPFR